MSLDATLRDEAVTVIREAALEAFDSHIHAILLKGSALRDDFLPGYSDLDIHIYVPSSHMRGGRQPRLENALRFQRAIGALDPTDYGVSSFQVFFIDAEHYPEDWSRPLKGTYEVLYGGPMDEASSREEHLRRSRENLSSYPGYIATLIERFVDKPDARIPDFVRLAGVFLKGAVYSASVAIANDPEVVVEHSLWELLGVLVDGGVETQPAEEFFRKVREWNEMRGDPEWCREAFGLAIQGMQNISDWFSGLDDQPSRH